MRTSRILLSLLACFATAAHAAPRKTAIFDLELVDTSPERVRADEIQRLALASAELRRLLAASGEVVPVDIAPAAAEIAAKGPLHTCNGCDEDIARSLGADLDVIGIVQKTSNLILSFAVEIKDAKTGKVIRAGQTDIRGNTDETWLRGVRYLVKNRLLAEPLPDQP